MDDKTQGLLRFGTWLVLRRLVSKGRPHESEAFLQLLMRPAFISTFFEVAMDRRIVDPKPSEALQKVCKHQ